MPIEDQAIYVWLTMPNEREPRAYVLPWSRNAAQQLQDAMNKAEANGTAVEMMLSQEQGHSADEPLFYARPQPPMPAKDDQGAGPLIYVQPGGAL